MRFLGRSTKIRWGLAALMLICGLSAMAQTGQTAKSSLKYRWVWIMSNLATDSEATRIQDILRRAKAAGYNGIALSDYKFNLLEQMGDNYFRNVASVKKLAEELHIEIFPTIFPIGYSNGLLLHDPNLIEGPPVKDAPFVVHNGQADIQPDPKATLTNADFEQANGDTMTGWAFQDLPGKATFADHETKHGGAQSLRMENIDKADPQNRMARIMQSVPVAPYRQLHLSVWIKTQAFENPGAVQGTVLSAKGRALNFVTWSIQKTQDWTQYHAVFNSLDSDKIGVYLGVWGGKGGKIWFDDAKVEEVGLLNVIRRKGCPVTVKGEDGTLYTEGKDYTPISDPKLGVIPYAGEYEVYHPAPPIRLLPGSRLKEGQRLKVSYFHAVTIYQGQVSSCISDPKVYEILQDQLTRVNKLLAPPGFFMSHDEFRVADWCDDCRARHLTPGQMLADNIRRCSALIRKARPDATQFVWQDMFDPYHNAGKGDYYLVNDGWDGAWEGLPKDVVAVNWNFDKRKESLNFFSKRGNPQILAGYYDAGPNQIRDWLDAAKGIPGVVGVMYTTWNANYTDLEAFAKAAWGQ